MIDRWDAMLLVGAAFLAGGVWARFGAPWASMLVGALMLSLAAVHAWRSA